jgi:hypothetical protein
MAFLRTASSSEDEVYSPVINLLAKLLGDTPHRFPFKFRSVTNSPHTYVLTAIEVKGQDDAIRNSALRQVLHYAYRLADA